MACLVVLALVASLSSAGTVQARSDVPDPVSELTATAGHEQITLQWDAAEGATGYRIRYYAVGYASIPLFPVDTTDTRHTFDNLMNNVEYVFEVSAMNEAGQESDPETVNAIPEERGGQPTPPSQILYVLLQPGDRQIEASWAQAADNGGLPVTGYRVEYRAGSGYWHTWPHPGPATHTTITCLSNDTSYAVRVSAFNGAGTGPASAPEYATPEQPPEPQVPTTPNQVTGLHLTAGNAQINASWNAPPDGGSPLTGYCIEYQAGNGPWQRWTHTGTSRNATLTELTNNTSYGVRVRAINAIGTGSAWAVRRATPGGGTTGPTTPGKPVVTLTPGNAQLGVTWTEPANNGAAITDYDVRYRAGTSGGWTDKPHTGTSRNTTITGLTNGQSYQVQVQAKNSAGSGPWSASATATPQPSVSAPGQPDAPTLTAGNTQIEVEWTEPANNGAAITDYDVEYRQGTSGNYTDWPHTGTTLNTTITGLTNGQSYQVRVRATNSAGSGPWSASATATPTASPRTVPVKPVVTLTPGNTQIEVEWTEPANNGAAITDYDVQYRQGNSGGWTDKPHTGTTRSTTIDSLTNGQSYQVRVRATNSAGSGAWSASATATPTASPRTVPVKPAVTLTAGNTQITANWPEPDTNGAAITDYDVEYRQGTSGNFTNWPHTGTARTATITGLTNDQSYQVRVRATNAAGSGAWSNLKEATPGSKSLVLSKTSHTVLEKGGTATWTVALSAQPSAYVTVAVASGNTSDATVSPASITVTSTNWQTAQDVTVTGVDDTSQNTDNKRDVTITHTASSDDDYDLTASVAVAVADDETETVADAIWSAVMVPGSYVSGGATVSGYSTTAGALSSNAITVGGSSYTVGSLVWDTVTNDIAFNAGVRTRLPTRLEPLRLRIDGTIYKLTWSSALNQYQLTGVTTNPFPEDAILEVHLIDSTPKNVAVAAGNAKLTVTWTDATGAASHQVRYKVSTASDWTEPTGNESSGYEITGLTNETEYNVQVGAVFGSDTWWSDTVKATPTPGEPPSGFAATGGNAEVELTWTGPTDSSITGWEFRYKSTGAYNNWAAITLDSDDTCHTTANTTCSHTVGSLTNNTEYTFQIRAVYGSAKGLASSEEKATPTATLRNFEVHPGNAMAKVFWDELAGADSYSVRYKVSTTNSWTTLTDQTSPVEIGSLTNATEYDF